MWLGGDGVEETPADESFLLALLNSTPVADGLQTDSLADEAQALAWLEGHGGVGTPAELREVIEVRDLLQAVVRGNGSPNLLARHLGGVTLAPAITDGRVNWSLSVPPHQKLAVRAILTWDALARNKPGRLRPCSNDECRLFLLDRSKANAARWCSMAVCGNRIKARRHYQRTRNPQER
jgi:predicted RNA-binding Zn ribbon-like protein